MFCRIKYGNERALKRREKERRQTAGDKEEWEWDEGERPRNWGWLTERWSHIALFPSIFFIHTSIHPSCAHPFFSAVRSASHFILSNKKFLIQVLFLTPHLRLFFLSSSEQGTKTHPCIVIQAVSESFVHTHFVLQEPFHNFIQTQLKSTFSPSIHILI